MPEGMCALEFGMGVLKRFHMRRVNEKQKKGKNLSKGIRYDILKGFRNKALMKEKKTSARRSLQEQTLYQTRF